MQFSENAHWRDSARPVRFFIWDGKTAFPLVLFIMHWAWWTLGIAVGGMIFFTILNRYGFSVEVFGRILRGFIGGTRKTAIPWWDE